MLFNIAMENPLYMEVLMGKSSKNGPFSMAMLNNQMVVYIYIYTVDKNRSKTERIHQEE